ncbi:beta-lactamase family protein [Catenulispora sp. NL8]|uniref:Beta-lactamase family protein n=1 Tax=Catenulispora pinistramenti TaxID=2705254 RepID=A0ABS5L7D6_9ACTN|nr:serine hydrolase domain-containing protein [Catenulispora pinistramenti]MBS2554125.1 beta-lactamase family protein [Catenulispora pinistramenti]
MSGDFVVGAGPGEIVAEAVRAGVVPGAVLMYGRGSDGPVHGAAFGAGVSPDTRYDLASLTKVTATLPCVLRLVEAGEIGLDDPVLKYLPGFGKDRGKDRVTVRHLLAHASGLPAILEVWRLPGTAEERFAAVLAEPLEAPVGTRVKYSDPGFILLGRIVADLTGKPLQEAFRELVADPLGMTATGYLPSGPAAATEANWFDDPERQDAKSGVVHDENAESLGGVAGQAGLFGTASDLAAYLRGGWLAEDSPILSGSMRAEALRCQTEGLDGRRGLGWTLRGDSFDFMSDRWPPTGAGHSGFTGTSLAFDPVSGIWCVLLTNAVLYGRDNRARQLRRSLHGAVAAAYGVAHDVAHEFAVPPGDVREGGSGGSLNGGTDGAGAGSRITT